MDNSALFTDSKKLTFKMNTTNYEDETEILPISGIKLGNFCR